MDGDSKEFSPMMVARAGRRAGRHVAIMDPGLSNSTEGATSEVGMPQPQQPQRQLSQQSSQRDRASQQYQVQPQPPPAPAQQQEQAVGNTQTAAASAGPAAQAAGPPAKRVGFAGFVDEEGGGQQQQFTGVSRRKQEQIQQEQIAESRQRNKYEEKAVVGVSDIPELEEEGKEDITRVVAQAPKSSGPRIQAMSELEQDQGILPSKPDSEDIDLSLLTACLLPSDQVIELPDVWDYDLLFSQLKAELQNEGGTADASKDGTEELRQI